MAAGAAITTLAAAPAVRAQDDDAKKSALTFVDTDTLTIEGSGEAVFGVQAQSNAWFNLLEESAARLQSQQDLGGRLAPSGNRRDCLSRGRCRALRPASLGISATLGTDIYNQTDQGRVLLENAYAGVRTVNPAASWNVDVSSGQRDYRVGSGMLIGQGADNGFERGALSWPAHRLAQSSVARLSFGGVSAEAFYLMPNPVQLFDTGTTLAGGVIQQRWDAGTVVGLSYMRVLT